MAKEKNEAKITDFGKKIGGARKDVWKSRGLSLDDLSELSDAEAKKYVTKDNVWPKPDWETKINEEKANKAVCYWQNQVRKSLPASTGSMTGDQKEERYVKVVGRIRDIVMSVKTPDEASVCYQKYIYGKEFVMPGVGRFVNITPDAQGILGNKFLKAIPFPGELYYKRKNEYIIFGVPKKDKEYTIRKNQYSVCCYDKKHVLFEAFGAKQRLRLTVKYGLARVYFYPEDAEEYSWTWKQDSWFVIDTATRQIAAYNLPSEEAANQKVEELATAQPADENESAVSKKRTAGKSQKQNFRLTELDRFSRIGREILQSEENVSPERFTETFPVKGGEFGNWLSNKERQSHLNMAYQAFSDLAEVLEIKPADVTFGGKLSIAFGSRGRGGQSAASAHFEPLLEVINLTKMHGAGCLAHEWGHAMDHFLAASVRDPMAMATETHYLSAYSPVLKKLLNAMTRRDDGTLTDFYVGSCQFDKMYRKSGHGYWSSRCEMFARAFDCYIKDKLTALGYRNDYLTSNADSFTCSADDGTTMYAYPTGETRTVLNSLFDQLIREIWPEESKL